MTRDKNKILRVQQAQAWLDSNEHWHDVLFTDETTVAMQGFADRCYRHREHQVFKTQPKHPLKVHVWGGISRAGPGPIYIFEGTVRCILGYCTCTVHYTVYSRIYKTNCIESI